MTSRLPWATATILIVAALAVGAWAVFGVPGEQPPSGEQPSEGVWTSYAVWGGATPSTSGIENVYFFNHGFGDDPEDNFFNSSTQGPSENENIYEYNNTDQVLEASGGTVNVNPDNAFDIVVLYKVDSTEVYDPTQTDNFRIEIILSGAISVEENDNSQVKFCIENDGVGTTWGRWVTVFNGGGNGYQLKAGSNFSIDNIALYGWTPG